MVAVGSERALSIRHTFKDQEAIHGFTNPLAIARELTHPLDPQAGNRQRQLERHILRMPTEYFLYDGAKVTVKNLLDAGDHVKIWTQGDETTQLWKIGMSRIGQLRKELPREERNRFSVFTSRDKVADLPDLLDNFQEKGITNIVIVDDKAENVVAADAQIAAWKKDRAVEGVNVQVVWINQGRTKDQVPPEFSLTSFQERYPTITEIQQLDAVRPQNGQTGWLIDFDHTLLHTEAAKENLIQKLATIVATHAPITSYELDHRLGLNGNVREVADLKSGMSDGRVLRVTTDTEDLVVKHNPLCPEKIHHEIDGYSQLLASPLAPHLLTPQFTSKMDSVITIPFFDGIQLREGVRNGDISPERALQTLSQLLTLKRNWWSNQEGRNQHQNFVSMQREEWKDTMERVDTAVQKLAQDFEIDLKALWTNPLVFEGRTYSPLIQTIGRVAEAMQKPPEQTVFAHNDATGANILISHNSNEWKIIDAEWVGPADPAEALVRMVKYISTTTAQAARVNARKKQGTLELDLDIHFPPAAVALQNYGLGISKQFGAALRDTSFGQRFQTYLAGSYIRELALTTKRGNAHLGFFAMLKASEAFM